MVRIIKPGVNNFESVETPRKFPETGNGSVQLTRLAAEFFELEKTPENIAREAQMRAAIQSGKKVNIRKGRIEGQGAWPKPKKNPFNQR